MTIDTIKNLAEFGVYTHATPFFYASMVAFPLIAVTVLAIKILSNPQIVPDNLLKIKKFVLKTFQRQENESKEEFERRLIKNVILSLLGLSVLIALAVVPFVMFPPSLAIPFAIGMVMSTAVMFKKIPGWKTKVIESFAPKPGETVFDTRERIAKNVLIASAIVATVVALSCITAHFALATLLATIAHSSMWTHMQPQLGIIVFLEYACVAVPHLLLSIYHFKNNRKALGVFHFINAVFGFAFPISYWMNNSPAQLRIHHSFMGLLFELIPFPPLQLFGLLIMLDSSLYWISANRGIIVDNVYWGWTDHVFHSADFMNIVVDHISAFLLSLTISCSLYLFIKEFFLSEEEKEKEIHQEQLKAVV